MVTVAICTWNRCELLEKTLSHMCRLSIPPGIRWELLIVDNNSTDATTAVIRQFAGALPIRSVHEPKPGISHARNRALREALGDVLLCTDDDVLVNEGWLAALVAGAREYPTAAAFGGPIEPWFPAPPDPDLSAAFPSLRDGFCGIEEKRSAGAIPEKVSLWGANMAFRRAAIAGLAFDAALGSSPTSAGGGDEVDFLRKVRARGGVVVWLPSMSVKHYVMPSRSTLAYLLDFTFAKGQETVRLQPSSVTDSPSFLGAPRWLWREWLVATGRHGLSRLGLPAAFGKRLRSGPPPDRSASPRARTLAWLRERLFLQGMLAEYRRPRRTSTSTVSRVEGPVQQA